MTDSIRTAEIRLAGADGDEISAYFAQPDTDSNAIPGAVPADATPPGGRGGVVLIHHMPGFDRWSKEVARRFAVDGYNVVAPNLFWRDAPGADPDDAAAAARARGGVPDDRLVGDVGAAVDYLRALPTSNGKVGLIGHCSGGRQTVLAACNLHVDAAVDCYGAFVVGTAPDGFPVKMKGLEDQLANLSCPLLGMFGIEDTYPSPDQVAELDRLLTGHSKQHDFHSYEGAGHGFFGTDRPAYRVEAATDGYTKIDAFFAQHLA
ncbi:dienelactone hydrolase family protein [Jatrophihabitans sp. DSM 45814]